MTGERKGRGWKSKGEGREKEVEGDLAHPKMFGVAPPWQEDRGVQ